MLAAPSELYPRIAQPLRQHRNPSEFWNNIDEEFQPGGAAHRST